MVTGQKSDGLISGGMFKACGCVSNRVQVFVLRVRIEA